MFLPTKAQQEVLNREIIFVYFENCVAHTDTLCRQAHIDSDVKTRGTFAEKQALKVDTESNPMLACDFSS